MGQESRFRCGLCPGAEIAVTQRLQPRPMALTVCSARCIWMPLVCIMLCFNSCIGPNPQTSAGAYGIRVGEVRISLPTPAMIIVGVLVSPPVR